MFFLDDPYIMLPNPKVKHLVTKYKNKNNGKRDNRAH